MSDNYFENVLFDNISGRCVIKDGGLLFMVSDNVYKWYFSNWIRSEKSKKSCKVRLTFKENSVRLIGDASLHDTLIKPIIVVDFGEDRNKLEEFCTLVSVETNKTKILTIESHPLQSVPKPVHQQRQYDKSRDREDLNDDQKLLLEKNPTILKLYNKFVNTDNTDVKSNISFNDFWQHHKIDLISISSQPKGTSNLDGFVSVPPNSNLVNGQNVFTYSKELTSALLSEDDTIRNLYTKLFLEEDITIILFYNLIGEKIPSNQILYDDIKGIPIKKSCTRVDLNELNNVDLNSNLLCFNDYNKVLDNSKYEKISKKFKNDNKEESILLDRFNRHSFNIINKCDLNTSHELQSKVEDERKRKILTMDYNDLEDPSYQIDEKCLIKSLSMPKMTNLEQEMDSNLIYNWIEELKGFDIIDYVKRCFNKIDNTTSRRMFILNTKLCQSEKLVHLLQFEYDPYTIDRMKDVQLQIIEVLQMYYKTLIPEEDKRFKLVNVLKNIKMNLESLQDAGLSVHTFKALQSGLMDQINALENYDNKLKGYIASLRSQYKPA